MKPAVPTVDLHADLLWRTAEKGKSPWAVCEGEMLDLPRMRQHGPSLQMFTLYTPGKHTGDAATAYARRLLAIWVGLVEEGAGRVGWVTSRTGLDHVASDTFSGILSMEGASPLRGEIALLDDFYAAGVRSLGLTHNPRNEAGDGCMVPDGERRGLTALGRAVVRRCAELGVLLDVAHLAPEGFRDLMDEVAHCPSPPPVVTTHTGAMAVTKHPRNLTDSQLRELAGCGGLAGVTFYPPHVAREGHAASLDDPVVHLEHMASVMGVEHVGVGADLDGFDPPGLPDGCDTPHLYGALEARLLARGWRREHVDGVLGGNALRVLGHVLR
ncbi:MAG: membrane dipeptidase [Planctomycetes bacterium]|nr:membrane dipeptidase [Planctomycetota bacterium]